MRAYYEWTLTWGKGKGKLSGRCSPPTIYLQPINFIPVALITGAGSSHVITRAMIRANLVLKFFAIHGICPRQGCNPQQANQTKTCDSWNLHLKSTSMPVWDQFQSSPFVYTVSRTRTLCEALGLACYVRAWVFANTGTVRCMIPVEHATTDTGTRTVCDSYKCTTCTIQVPVLYRYS